MNWLEEIDNEIIDFKVYLDHHIRTFMLNWNIDEKLVTKHQYYEFDEFRNKIVNYEAGPERMVEWWKRRM